MFITIHTVVFVSYVSSMLQCGGAAAFIETDELVSLVHSFVCTLLKFHHQYFAFRRNNLGN